MVLNISCIRSSPIDKDYTSPISFGQVFILAESHVLLFLKVGGPDIQKMLFPGT